MLVPDEVAEEIEEYGPDDPTVRALARTAWLEVVETPPAPDSIARLKLGAGETAVLTWALTHPGTTLVLDDMAARRAAVRLGPPLVGTLGVVLAARDAGLTRTVRPVLEDLRRAGMYLSRQAMNQALALVGE
jgi:predicted nucleic acid-binding protein